MSCHSVAVVLTLDTDKTNRNTQTKQHKEHGTNNTKHSKYKYIYYQNTHTLQNKLKQPHYKIHTKQNSRNTIKCPQYKFTLMHMVLLSQELHRNSLHLTSK